MAPRAGSAAFASKRAKLAALIRHGADPTLIEATRAELVAAERDQRVDVLVEHVRRVTRDLPPLTDDQRARVVAALQPAPAATA